MYNALAYGKTALQVVVSKQSFDLVGIMCLIRTIQWLCYARCPYYTTDVWVQFIDRQRDYKLVYFKCMQTSNEHGQKEEGLYSDRHTIYLGVTLKFVIVTL